MIRTKTLFIVGAGASFEVGLPLGADLTTRIANALDFRSSRGASSERDLVRAAISVLCKRPNAARDANGLFAKASQISRALATAASIDVFIDNHSHDSDVAIIGKLGIAACLIEAERNSMLCPPHPASPINLAGVPDNWFVRLFHILAEGIKAHSIESMFDNVEFVVFNYDRCIELFLEQAISSRFLIDLSRARRIVRDHCPILHVYGSLGSIFDNDRTIDFGCRLDPGTFIAGDTVVRMSENLRTFAEAEAGANGPQVKKFVSGAHRLVFLGFGFHPQNVELLKVDSSDIREYRATVFGMSDSNQIEVREILSSIVGRKNLGNGAQLVKLPCKDMIPAEQLFLSR